MTTENPKTEIEVPKSGAPEPKPEARRRKLRKIGGLIAGAAAVGTVLAGLTGYWTTYRTVLGRADEASAALAELQKRAPGYTVQKILALYPSANPKLKSQIERFAEGLRKAGLPEH